MARGALAAGGAEPWPEAERAAAGTAAAAVAAEAAAADAVVAEAGGCLCSGMAITDAAGAALARARAAAPGAGALTTSRPQGTDGSADYGPASGLPAIRTSPPRNSLAT